MRKRQLFLFCLVLASLPGCQYNTDNNKTLGYDSLQVNFSASINGQTWAEGDRLTILATCSREEKTDCSMSENPVAEYITTSAGNKSMLIPATDSDKVISLSGDHNFRFYGIYPCPEGSVDLSDIPVAVPAIQKSSEGLMKNLTFLGSTTSLTVLPTIELEMNTIFSVLSFYIPNDLRDGFESTLSRMEITPGDPDKFNGYLAQAGSYDAKKEVFTLDTSKSSNKITVDFGEGGLPLTSVYTRVDVAIAPMVIPEGGLSIRFVDKDGSETIISALASEKETGAEIKAGDSFTSYISGTSDGIIPVTFPVVFPLGYPNGDNTQTGYCNVVNEWMNDWVNDPACVSSTRTSQLWTGHHGTLYCADQNQAYITWNWAEDIVSTETKHFIETSNSANYHISTFGVKGVWTNDYFEIVIPVRKFAAGSSLTLTMPFYTRSGPTFWEVLYKDGEDWKSTAIDNLPAFEGSDVTRRATWAIPFGGAAASANIDTDQTVTVVYENEVKSGILYIRVRCVDGSIVSSATNAVSTLSTPNGGATANAPFYFWNPDPNKRLSQAITIEVK